MSKPFLIDAILGNSRLLATMTRDAEIQRLFWPHIDGGQHVERLLGGVSIGGAPVLWQDDAAWQHEQAYEPDQNILVTTSRLPGRLAVRSVDAATPGSDVLVRRLTFTNVGAEPLDLAYAFYQWIRVDENPLYNTVLFDERSDSLIHFRRDIFLATGADREISTFVIGSPERVFQAASELAFTGGAVLHGDMAGAALWELGSLQPGASVDLTLYLVLEHSPAAVRDLLARVRAAGPEGLLSETRQYWTDWLAQARPLNVPAEVPARTPALQGIPASPAPASEVEALYRRSLLVFKLMSDEQTGAVIAAPEFDPGYTSCGGYAYCWGRDAAYITTAMDLAGYHGLAAKFYDWALTAQEPEGWWMHRHYASGHWGPSWGLIQVDETGSILYGMALHAKLHGGDAFARKVWPNVKKAADWLIGDIDPETGLPFPAVDLWEERMAELTYSSAAVYAGLRAAAELALRLGEGECASRYLEAAAKLQQAILRECVRDGSFLRGRWLHVSEAAYEVAVDTGKEARMVTGAKGHPVYQVAEDPVPDSSLLGMVHPFRVVEHEDPVMVKTVERLVANLWTSPGGGMIRYTNDHYRGGRNPWVLCTLWLGLYEAERGNRELARQILDWAVARRTVTGVLPEQVDPVDGAPVWVVPLTWSHAMYVLLALELYGA